MGVPLSYKILIESVYSDQRYTTMLQIDSSEKKIAAFNFIFGIIVVAGGVIGFLTAQSAQSLAAGLVFGNLLMLSVWGTPLLKGNIRNKQVVWGYYLSTILSVILLIFFLIRLIKTGKAMPASIIITLSVLSIMSNIFVLNKQAIGKKG